MAKCRIRYTQAAIDDLDAIFNYTAVEDQDAALRMVGRFESSVQRLSDTPNLGAAISSTEPGFVEEGYRHLLVSPYLIFYRVKENEVRIGRILHSRQDWLHLLFGSGKPKA